MLKNKNQTSSYVYDILFLWQEVNVAGSQLPSYNDIKFMTDEIQPFEQKQKETPKTVVFTDSSK